MPEMVFDRWFFIIIFAVSLIVVAPLLVVLVILQLPSWLAFVATVSIIILWGVAAGYKDWVISKRREAEEKPEPDESEG